jgi:hypothetical protein
MLKGERIDDLDAGLVSIAGYRPSIVGIALSSQQMALENPGGELTVIEPSW